MNTVLRVTWSVIALGEHEEEHGLTGTRTPDVIAGHLGAAACLSDLESQSTRELVEALRHATKGHRLAYESILHQNIGEGNVMIAPEGALFKKYTADFNILFNWNEFPAVIYLEISIESWKKYARMMEALRYDLESRSNVSGEDLVDETARDRGVSFLMADCDDIFDQLCIPLKNLPILVPGNQPVPEKFLATGEVYGTYAKLY
ncbi:predicted protein [Postia placenta Mad-698-R]|nr:predicted protein [Postia placenta Mad-698-R]